MCGINAAAHGSIPLSSAPQSQAKAERLGSLCGLLRKVPEFRKPRGMRRHPVPVMALGKSAGRALLELVRPHGGNGVQPGGLMGRIEAEEDAHRGSHAHAQRHGRRRRQKGPAGEQANGVGGRHAEGDAQPAAKQGQNDGLDQKLVLDVPAPGA